MLGLWAGALSLSLNKTVNGLYAPPLVSYRVVAELGTSVELKKGVPF